mgnify:CR=1 FL=1
MEGITILNSEVIMAPHWGPIALFILGVVSILFLLFLMLLGFDHDDMLTALIVSAGIALIGLISSFIIQVPKYTSYEVILEDSVSINEFLDRYKILDQRGQIYVVKEKEK